MKTCKCNVGWFRRWSRSWFRRSSPHLWSAIAVQRFFWRWFCCWSQSYSLNLSLMSCLNWHFQAPVWFSDSHGLHRGTQILVSLCISVTLLHELPAISSILTKNMHFAYGSAIHSFHHINVVKYVTSSWSSCANTHWFELSKANSVSKWRFPWFYHLSTFRIFAIDFDWGRVHY